MKKCKHCNKKLDKNHRVYCSRLCQNRWQARNKNGFKGKHHTKELKERWSVDRKKNYNLSYHKAKCYCSFCRAKRGEFGGLNTRMNKPGAREKLSKKMLGRKIFWKDKVSEGVKLAYKEGRLKKVTGKDSNFYIDGRTPLRFLLRNSDKYKAWRKAIFERDNFTCQDCGDATGGNLEAHHKKPFTILLAEFLNYYNCFSPLEEKYILLKLAIEKWPDFWGIEKGTTLCEKCHDKIRLRNKGVRI